MSRRSLFLAFLLLLAGGFRPAAAQNKVHDVDIRVTLDTDGSAAVREVWDMTLSAGTEVYLGRVNLGDIRILDLTVSDETGLRYRTDRSWDTGRSFAQKAGRCGLHAIDGGYEICWGIGEYGHRVYTVDYRLTHLVKSLEDYDMIHYQFYTPNDFKTGHVRVTLEKPGFAMDTLTRIWAFGYSGTSRREDGKLVFESDKPLAPTQSLIALVRFEKGIFSSESVQARPFQAVLDRALEGAEEPSTPMSRREKLFMLLVSVLTVIGIVLLPFLPLLVVLMQRRRAKKNAFGTTKLKTIGWGHELPYGGEILQNNYVISYVAALKAPKNSVASAMILDMLQKNCLRADRNLSSGKVDIGFDAHADLAALPPTEASLWQFMYEASGENRILEEKEFSKWAKGKTAALIDWTAKVKSGGLEALRAGGYYDRGKFTEKGQAENRKIVSFKKFLEDATLIRERTVPEAALWRDYLVFAALVGIADKVAKELRNIDPVVFEQACTVAVSDMPRVIYLSNAYSDTLTRFSVPPSTSGGFSGGAGGRASFGGGGGFSGGGFSGVR